MGSYQGRELTNQSLLKPSENTQFDKIDYGSLGHVMLRNKINKEKTQKFPQGKIDDRE